MYVVFVGYLMTEFAQHSWSKPQETTFRVAGVSLVRDMDVQDAILELYCSNHMCLTLYSIFVTICTASFNIQNLCVLPT